VFIAHIGKSGKSKLGKTYFNVMTTLLFRTWNPNMLSANIDCWSEFESTLLPEKNGVEDIHLLQKESHRWFVSPTRLVQKLGVNVWERKGGKAGRVDLNE
jgi:hypothetical protein